MNQLVTVENEHSASISGSVMPHVSALASLCEAFSQYLMGLPSELQQTGEACLQCCTDKWNSVGWVLPLILGDAWSVPKEYSQLIALANAQMSVAGHIQQQSENTPIKSSDREILLASLLNTRALRQYQQLFPPSSNFWPLLDGYQLEWAEAILWQKKRRWNSVHRYTHEDILRLAGNHALFKIGGAAIVLFARRPPMLMPLSTLLDQVHVALQLLDSVLNWRQDLQTQQASYFLTEVAIALQSHQMASLGRVDWQAFLATSPLPGQAIKHAQSYLSTARKLAGHLQVPALVGFLDVLQSSINGIHFPFEVDPADTYIGMEHAPVSLLPL